MRTSVLVLTTLLAVPISLSGCKKKRSAAPDPAGEPAPGEVPDLPELVQRKGKLPFMKQQFSIRLPKAFKPAQPKLKSMMAWSDKDERSETSFRVSVTELITFPKNFEEASKYMMLKGRTVLRKENAGDDYVLTAAEGKHRVATMVFKSLGKVGLLCHAQAISSRDLNVKLTQRLFEKICMTLNLD
jgi:hypothetical protein